MLLMSGAVVGTFGILGTTLVALVVALVVVRHRRMHTPSSDTEQALADLLLRLRHPWRYRLTRGWRT